jgi:uncharacterized phage-associated protein
MSRLRLLKLLYVADRESLAERGRPITGGDHPVAMDNGPVPGRTYALFQGEDVASRLWQTYIHPQGPWDVRLARDPGVGKLSRQEVAKLQDVATRFERTSDRDLAECTREYTEWRKNVPAEGSSKEIPLDDLLEATGMLANKDALLDRERAESAAARVFGD